MALRLWVGCVVVLATPLGRAEEAGGGVVDGVRAVLSRAGTKLGTELRAMRESEDGFAGSLTNGLKTCDQVDLEVHVRDGDVVEVVTYPRVHGERLDPAKAADRPALLKKLGTPSKRMAPLAWAEKEEKAIRASCTIRWGDASAAETLEGALLAAVALDQEVAELLPCFQPKRTEEEVTARLREASTDEARRGEILASIASDLPEVAPSKAIGKSSFQKIVLNGRGVGLDAFRFRVPADEGEYRLVWAFAYPPGTAKGWYIAPVTGDAPKFVKFHRGKTYEGSGVPAEHATLLQRTETPLRAGAEYVVWFQLKVETPVDLYVALGCFPYVKSDRDTPAVLEAALGLKSSD